MVEKLTKEKAVEISIELWGWLAETGKGKEGWPGWKKYGGMRMRCPLCELSQPHSADCGVLPCSYYDRYGHCMDGPFNDWVHTGDVLMKKKYAALFLEQLRGLVVGGKKKRICDNCTQKETCHLLYTVGRDDTLGIFVSTVFPPKIDAVYLGSLALACKFYEEDND